jgi:hypothetical protein
MQFNANKLGIAAALTSALLYTVCYALVAIAPELTMSITSHVFHMRMGQVGWALSWVGFAMGLICTVGLSYLTLWLFGVIYNGLLDPGMDTSGTAH